VKVSIEIANTSATMPIVMCTYPDNVTSNASTVYEGGS